MPRTDHPIIALDPGLRDLGYAVLRGNRIVASGVLTLRQFRPSSRPAEVRTAVQTWIRAYRARTLVIEQTARHASGWLRPLSRLSASLARFARRRNLAVATYSARTVRKNVVGNGWATKREVAEVLSARYPTLRVHLTQDRKWKERYWQNMFDAIALGLHHQSIKQPPSRSRSSG